MIPAVLVYLLVVNVAAYAAFAYDKARAVRGRRRVPERRLLGLALIGGSVGAVVAQRRLRHKTQKEPFRSRLRAILVLHGLLLLGAAVVGADELAMLGEMAAGAASKP
ncbi:DUF1294 domain-containing protein [Aurantimonas aggregata]|uniref:DUF1294 domain-containing protein n=1 Tax=Aurantimonas aggregata TaxID=2047720 RepID=A0A6L9MHQ1_9HYPH|nr:DUF1294 domain-containing protein [Aurantimonas aggregata]NDV87000.1 DUF1294 domain-containing protein [Aurantimonas aggregata]